VLGGVLRLAGVDLSKIRNAVEIVSEGKPFVTSRTTVRLTGGEGPPLEGTLGDRALEAPEAIESGPTRLSEPASTRLSEPAEPAARHTVRLQRVSALERQQGRTVERPRGFGLGTLVLALLVGAVVAAVLILYVLP
jgi:hypothetical protein